FLISKRQQLRVLPISLFLLILLSTFGPWGALQVSVRAQLKEFEELHSEILSAGNQVSQTTADRFENLSRYLARRDRLQEAEGVLGFDPAAAFSEENEYNIGRQILDSLNIEIVQDSSRVQPFQDFFRNTPLVV